MTAFDPFDDAHLKNLVRIETGKRVHTREGVQKEFKESFSWASLGEYARTMAAFANARGGYLIFGVTDNPRIAKGLSEQSRESFDNLDRARLTAGLNDYFSPEIDWEASVFSVGEVTLGGLYVFESVNKPVVAKKSYGNSRNIAFVEGDVLYRYNSRTERAKYPEVRRMLDEARSSESAAIMRHFDEILRAGAKNAAVLDLTGGSITGPNGQRVLMDEKLLTEIAFIKEGEFDEVSGKPTLKVVGEVEPVGAISLSSSTIVRQTITTEDVITDFLDQTKGTEPQEYIKQAATGTTAFVPIYFYGRIADLDDDQIIDFVAGVATRSPAKSKLLDRLETGMPHKEKPPAKEARTDTGRLRRGYFDELAAGSVPAVSSLTLLEARCFADAVRCLDSDEFMKVKDELLEALKDLMAIFYSSDGTFADKFRRAVCRVDSELYGKAP